MSKSIMIGRSSSNDYVINDPYAGREHAQILLTDENEIFIIDLASKSGTTINGRLLDANIPYKLNEYDIVRTADTLIPWKDFLSNDNLKVKPQENIVGNLDETIIKEKEPVESLSFYTRILKKISIFFRNLFGG